MRKRPNPRKKQSGLPSVRLILLFATLMVVGLLMLASLLGGRFGALHQITMDLMGPLQEVSTKSVSYIASIKNDYLALVHVREENKELHAMVDKFTMELAERTEAYRKYKLYEELLEFKQQQAFDPVTARVVGKDPAQWFQTILVDCGKSDDVVEGMVVYTPQGVVGQVIHTSNNYSKVLLANAPSSAIDALVQKNSVRGILKGAGKNGYLFNYVLKNDDVEVGDKIVTAGIGGVFAPGIVLGEVSEIHKQKRGMFHEIIVEPSVDFQKLEVVFIDLTDRKRILREMSMDEGL